MPTKREELQQEIEKRTVRMQGLIGDLTKAEEFKKESDELRTIVQQAQAMDKAEADMAETRAALSKVPIVENAPGAVVASSGWGEVRKAMLQAATEKRAVTANGAGGNTVAGIVKALVDGGKIAPKVAKFFGPNSQTVVPVFAPHLALPAGQTEGGTGIGADSTAVLAGKSLTLKPWLSILAVSNGALISTDIESELPGIFAEAFGAAIDKAICVGAGSGNDALGVFIASASGVTTGSDIACAAAGAPKWVDYVGMALTLLGTMNGPLEAAAIIVHPSVFKVALTDTSAGTDPFRIEYLTKGTILGIPVILSGFAPTTLTAGSYVAVGGYFRHYALAMAQQITIKPIDVVGSDNVTFQASVYMQGTPLIGGSFARLKTV